MRNFIHGFRGLVWVAGVIQQLRTCARLDVDSYVRNAYVHIGIIHALIGCWLVGCPITSIMLNRRRPIGRPTDVQQR